MNSNKFLGQLDRIEMLLADIARTRRTAVSHMTESKPHLAVAQAELLSNYVDTLVSETVELVRAGGRIGVRGGVLECLS